MRFFFSALILFLSLPVLTNGQEYLWPTDAGQFLSSTFGETRAEHFHAGLDIKTWGREGYRVFASRDGILHRLLVTEQGYGKAIYLKHTDGTYTIYAHLQRFNSAFQAITDSIRLKDYLFEMDATLDTLQIPVHQGELIGYTGSTGIGPPHLHFEVRDSLENPVNALTKNLTIQDRLPPVFSTLIVEPLDINSRVAGKPVSYLLRSIPVSNNKYDFGEIKINGSVGLAVNVYDQADDVPNMYAVYSLALLNDQDTLFYEKLDQFSYGKTREMYLDRITPFGSTKRNHQRLYQKDGGQNPFYIKIAPGSIIRILDSPITYTLVASDYFGNTSRAEVTISKKLNPPKQLPGFNLPVKQWYWSENWASPDLNSTLDLTQNNIGIPWEKNQHITYFDSANVANFARIIPGKKQKVISPDHRMLLRFGEQAFFDTLTIASSYYIKNKTIYLSVQPQMLSPKSDFGIEFFLGDFFEPGNNYRLFRKKQNDGELKYVDSNLIGGTIHAYPSELGEFVIIADNTPPEISEFKIYQTDYGQWLGSVHVRDELSGINSSKTEFYINGKRGIAEYDYEEDLLLYYMPDFTPDSVNTVQISVEDKVGNRTSIILEKKYPEF